MEAPRLSVVIPTLDAATSLPALLTDLRQAPFPLEILVVDGGSRDESGKLATDRGCRLLMTEAGRGRQLAAGAAAATAPWLLFLHADTVLSPGWADAAQRHIAERPERAGWFRLAFDSRHPMARATAAWARTSILRM